MSDSVKTLIVDDLADLSQDTVPASILKPKRARRTKAQMAEARAEAGKRPAKSAPREGVALLKEWSETFGSDSPVYASKSDIEKHLAKVGPKQSGLWASVEPMFAFGLYVDSRSVTFYLGCFLVHINF